MIGVQPITEFRNYEIFVTPHVLENTPEEFPTLLLAFSHMFRGSLEPGQRSLWPKNVVATTLRASPSL